jgi:hypothetical protein
MDDHSTSSLEAARAAKPKALKLFAALASQVSVGITRIGAGYGLKVNLHEQLPTGQTPPTQVDGVPVRLEIVGPLRKQGS